MKKYFLLILLGFSFLNAQSQMIKAIPFEKENSVFKLSYDLPVIAKNYDVILTSNYPTGKGFVKVTENALGDIGQNIPNGTNKTIYWQPKKGETFNEAILEFKIVMIPLASANNDVKIPENVIAKRKEEEAKRKAEEIERKRKMTETESNTNIELGNEEEPKPNKAENEISTGISGAGADIKGRTVRSKPQVPQNPGVNGVIIVTVCVNTKGKVVKAKFSQKGSTVTDDVVIGQAVTNSREWKFNENSMAAEKQCGTIKYYYKVK